MDREYFEKIIYKFKSNRLKEDFIKKNYIEFYDFIVLNYVGETFLEKLYIFYIGKSFCECGEKTRFISFSKGYSKYCGYKCSSNSKYVRDKYKKTCNDKYGYNNPSKSLDIKKKKENTFLEKYGVKSYLQTESVKSIIREKYNVDNVFESDIIKDKIRKTNLVKYGVEFSILNKEIKEKSIEKIRERYGFDSFSKTDEFKERMSMHNFEKFEKDFKLEGYELISKDSFNNKLKHFKCQKTFEIQTQLVRKRHNELQEICLYCNPFIPSYKEKELFDFIESLGFFAKKYRDNKYEIDVFIEDSNIGFEFNGLYWHSELFKCEKYHYDKYQYFKNKGINLISIYEDDWIYKKDIVKSIIKSKLNKLQEKIYARNCKIVKVNNRESKEFLDENHLQGWCVSKFRYALLFNNKLVSVLTLGSNRINLGQKNIDGNYEILRFCNRQSLNVIGGFSKLLKFFIKENMPKKIITYADCSISNGNLYIKNGFDFIKFTNPNYFYFLPRDKKRINRFNFTKSKLVKMGFDLNKTEKEIMFERGYFKIYDSGSYKFEMNL